MSAYSTNIVTENGEQFIPASQRPDGTWRKARRVKDGYVPQEEVPLYESKGKQFMSKKQEPVKLSTGQVAHRPIPGLFIIENDNEKKNQSKKKQKKKVEDVTNQLENVKLSSKPAQKNEPKMPVKPVQTSADTSKSADTATDPQKKLKNLKKRLREVESLEEKLKNGTIMKPEPEQLAKVKRKNDLLLQIHELEKQVQ
ncbi:unnamed protein product [Acanthoscelides obtectus]|uniref:Partner of Y14 and mago n=1 Tax=Acanthoscelides obtectus TaxID=200917 RepID=A0A9P0PFN5_ACAOB|nr:unnamed protein product [Acanthoscelides obtectus]CAK1675011.1 Partner of Y14 and mago [Acanthoscelides obtectus]